MDQLGVAVHPLPQRRHDHPHGDRRPICRSHRDLRHCKAARTGGHRSAEASGRAQDRHADRRHEARGRAGRDGTRRRRGPQRAAAGRQGRRRWRSCWQKRAAKAKLAFVGDGINDAPVLSPGGHRHRDGRDGLRRSHRGGGRRADGRRPDEDLQGHPAFPASACASSTRTSCSRIGRQGWPV